MLYAGCPLRRDGVDGTTSSDYYTDPGSNNFNPGVSSGSSYTTSSGEVITVYTYDLDEYHNAVGRALTIPSTIDGYTVVGIGENAFQNRTGLGSVKIPNTVTYIGSYAFGGCNALTSITIPESLTECGFATFEGCTGLASVTPHSGMTEGSHCSVCDTVRRAVIPPNPNNTNTAPGHLKGCPGAFVRCYGG